MLKLSQRLVLAVVGCAVLGGGACSDDSAVPLVPVTYELSITAYNGEPGDAVALRCDGTLSVTVSVAPTNTFALRPANACGTSTRCGYVHFEALTENGDVLASTDSATLEGVLRLPDAASVGELHQIQVSLRSGVDNETIVNADGTEAKISAEPRFDPTESCEDLGAGGAGGGPGGVGGASEAGAGGAGGQTLGGAGGQAPGGAGGQAQPPGGAGGQAPGGAGGEASNAGAGGG